MYQREKWVLNDWVNYRSLKFAKIPITGVIPTRRRRAPRNISYVSNAKHGSSRKQGLSQGGADRYLFGSTTGHADGALWYLSTACSVCWVIPRELKLSKAYPLHRGRSGDDRPPPGPGPEGFVVGGAGAARRSTGSVEQIPRPRWLRI